MSFDRIIALDPGAPRGGPGWATWTSLSPMRPTAIAPPAFILGDCPAALAASYHDNIGEAQTGIYRLHETQSTGHGALLRGRELIAFNLIGNSLDWCRYYLDRNLLRDPASYHIRRARQVALIVGDGYTVYGHWLVDTLPKLFALHLAGYAIDGLTFLCPADVPQFGLDWLRLVGIRDEQLLRYDPAREIVSCETLLVPSLLRSGSRASVLFTPAAQFILQRLAQHGGYAPPAPTREAIFVSRARADRAGRTLGNRAAVERLAQDQGYRIVYPEQMPIPEQVAWFARSDRVVGEYGSALHNTMFSPPGTMTCALRSAAVHPGFLQSGMAQAMGQRCGYVLGPAPLNAVTHVFDVALADVSRALQLINLPLQ